MTHDEIDQMDAAQLRLEVAMVKGYIDNRQFCENEFLGPDNEWYYLESEYSSDRILPNWPADIAAAMGLFLELPLPRRIHQEDGTFYVLCGGRSYGPSTDMEMDFYAEVDEEGEPNALCVAICRAYLMWKQG